MRSALWSSLPPAHPYTASTAIQNCVALGARRRPESLPTDCAPGFHNSPAALKAAAGGRKKKKKIPHPGAALVNVVVALRFDSCWWLQGLGILRLKLTSPGHGVLSSEFLASFRTSRRAGEGLREQFLTRFSSRWSRAQASFPIPAHPWVPLYLLVIGAEFLECLWEGCRIGHRQSGWPLGRLFGILMVDLMTSEDEAG